MTQHEAVIQLKINDEIINCRGDTMEGRLIRKGITLEPSWSMKKYLQFDCKDEYKVQKSTK